MDRHNRVTAVVRATERQLELNAVQLVFERLRLLGDVSANLLVRLRLGQLGHLHRLPDAALQGAPGGGGLVDLRQAAHRVLGRDVVRPEVGLLGLGLDASGFGF